MRRGSADLDDIRRGGEIELHALGDVASFGAGEADGFQRMPVLDHVDPGAVRQRDPIGTARRGGCLHEARVGIGISRRARRRLRQFRGGERLQGHRDRIQRLHPLGAGDDLRRLGEQSALFVERPFERAATRRLLRQGRRRRQQRDQNKRTANHCFLRRGGARPNTSAKANCRFPLCKPPGLHTISLHRESRPARTNVEHLSTRLSIRLWTKGAPGAPARGCG